MLQNCSEFPTFKSLSRCKNDRPVWTLDFAIWIRSRDGPLKSLAEIFGVLSGWDLVTPLAKFLGPSVHSQDADSSNDDVVCCAEPVVATADALDKDCESELGSVWQYKLERPEF